MCSGNQCHPRGRARSRAWAGCRDDKSPAPRGRATSPRPYSPRLPAKPSILRGKRRARGSAGRALHSADRPRGRRGAWPPRASGRRARLPGPRLRRPPVRRPVCPPRDPEPRPPEPLPRRVESRAVPPPPPPARPLSPAAAAASAAPRPRARARAQREPRPRARRHVSDSASHVTARRRGLADPAHLAGAPGSSGLARAGVCACAGRPAAGLGLGCGNWLRMDWSKGWSLPWDP